MLLANRKIMQDFNIEVSKCDNVYWASTDQYTLMVNGHEHVIRRVEDSDGTELLYQGPWGWESIFNFEEDAEVASIIENLESGELDLNQCD